MGKKSNSNGDVVQSKNSTCFIGSSVVPLINKLQDIFAPLGDIDDRLTGLRLPQVAVIGSQSSGKSSVLEALVGRDFLPRGTDICTRRPLLLQLEKRTIGVGDNDSREYGEFGHLPDKRFYDFSAIRCEILGETAKEVGVNKGVSDKQIRLKICSPNVLNITLVDLPGITKVPVGDQPSDIEARIRNMIMSYIKQETSIILAVSPANADLANSDALQMAKEVDPTGTRTIGVITKLDIMDKGTDARNFLLGKVIPLRLGYVGVVNRSQQDINNKRSIEEALAYEEQFFRDYHVYHGLSDRCGIPQLAKKLNQILEQHIRNVLPTLKTDLNSHLVAVEKELRTYGEALESNAERGVMLLNVLTKYSEAFSAVVDGKSEAMTTKELSGGARIHHIFQSIFVKSLEEVDPCEDLSNEDIRIAIHNATGPRNALFVPEVPFEVLVRRQIARLLDPSLQCLRFVYDELIKISRACETFEMRRFLELRRRLEDVTARFLRDGVKPAERMITNLIEMEKDYINSSHPNFIGGTKAVDMAQMELRAMQEGDDADKDPAVNKGHKLATVAKFLNGALPSQVGRTQSDNDRVASVGTSTTRTWGVSSLFGSRGSSVGNSSKRHAAEVVHDIDQAPPVIQLKNPPSMLRPGESETEYQVEIVVTKILITSYYDIVRRNIQDLVPKAIMHYLVNHAKRHLLGTFIEKLYRENLFEDLLQEQDEVVTKRRRTLEMCHALQQAVETLDEFVADISTQRSSDSMDASPKSSYLSSDFYSNSRS
ncbi:PREDICTED: dynamin-related protein 3A-like isoform X1 [Nicotiana attenuata]|uniref:dynamin-related protein 3A-like isoform X1 n=1 Tax=Nicotiana attenuata TaxID=49451 RepID=UPI0009046432|nr:PREDICTED: dynamin-related protein 3A-like isoform X1 [Nicotiana attenuata]